MTASLNDKRCPSSLVGSAVKGNTYCNRWFRW